MWGEIDFFPQKKSSPPLREIEFFPQLKIEFSSQNTRRHQVVQYLAPASTWALVESL